MVILKKIVYSFIICIMLTGCESCQEFGYDKKLLTYKNVFVFDNQFRMDGIYIRERKDIGADEYSMMYFFQDGYYFSAISNSEDLFSFECQQLSSEAKKLPYLWGCFIVEDNIIKMQHFSPSGGTLDFEFYERWGKIINDTTIYFFKETSPNAKVIERDLNDTFHFRYCNNKPDSTNVLMDW